MFDKFWEFTKKRIMKAITGRNTNLMSAVSRFFKLPPRSQPAIMPRGNARNSNSTEVILNHY